MNNLPVILPERPIIDAHHHIWHDAHFAYSLDDYLGDIGSGHNIIASVHVQANDCWYRPNGPEALRPVGETETCAALHKQAVARSGVAVCAGIVGYADLTLGEGVRDVLEAHIAAGEGLFRGIRVIAQHDSSGSVLTPGSAPPAGLYEDKEFRTGFAQLEPLGLSFDAWQYHMQLPDLISLARAFPNTRIIADHCGGVLNISAHGGKEEVFHVWARDIQELAGCANVFMKVSGFGMHFWGFPFRAEHMPEAAGLAAAWRPYVEECLESFGAARCMFASNFPQDRPSCDYRTLWNALKLLSAGASADESTALFSGTARDVYRLDLHVPAARLRTGQ